LQGETDGDEKRKDDDSISRSGGSGFEEVERRSRAARQPRSQRGDSGDASPDVDSELRGRTLQAYLYMLRGGKPVGVRELQRALSLSSPSVAYHHLEKLERLRLVEKDQYGEYALIKNVDVNVLQAFTHIGRLLVPRFIFYAVFFTTLLIGYALISQQGANIFALAFGIFAAAFAWFETLRTWSKRPF
jgi:DNA-binding transcriptional ArsR family regulator